MELTDRQVFAAREEKSRRSCEQMHKDIRKETSWPCFECGRVCTSRRARATAPTHGPVCAVCGSRWKGGITQKRREYMERKYGVRYER